MVNLFTHRLLAWMCAALLGAGSAPSLCIAQCVQPSQQELHDQAFCCLSEQTADPSAPAEATGDQCPPAGLCGLCPAFRAATPTDRQRVVESDPQPVLVVSTAPVTPPTLRFTHPLSVAPLHEPPLRSLVELHCQLTC